jgi:hypothetical protein
MVEKNLGDKSSPFGGGMRGRTIKDSSYSIPYNLNEKH